MRGARWSLALVLVVAAVACKGRFRLSADGRFVTQIAIADGFGCVRMKDGSVRTWGKNGAGELGDGTTEERPESARAGALAFSKVAAGGTHACALAADGDVFCWGANDAGQLGDGTRATHTAPAPAGTSKGVALALGDRHSCVLTAAGEVFCWGASDAGQLGGGEPGKPVLGDVTSIAAGGDATCAVLRSRGVACWGRVPGRAEAPVTRIEGLADVVQLAVTGTHACAVRAWGGIACWGKDEEGELGDGAFTDRAFPVDVVGLALPAVEAAVGRRHSCARLRNSTVHCWGANASAQLADGTSAHRASPGLVNGLFEVEELVAAGDATCVRFPDGSERCWGGLRLPKTEGAVIAVPTEVRW